MFSKRRVETSTLNQKKTRGGKYAASRTAKKVRNKKRELYTSRHYNKKITRFIIFTTTETTSARANIALAKGGDQLKTT